LFLLFFRLPDALRAAMTLTHLTHVHIFQPTPTWSPVRSWRLLWARKLPRLPPWTRLWRKSID
jgi:hypothetical protein